MAGEAQKYLVRDPQGNVYGPADAELLREWVREGRIVPGMAIAPRETREWGEAAEHPAIRDLLEERIRAAAAGDGGKAEPMEPAQPVAMPAAPVKLAGEDAGMMVVRRPAPTRPVGPAGWPEVGYSTTPAVHNTLGILSFIFGVAGMLSVGGMCMPPCVCVVLPMNGLMDLTAVVLGIVALSQIHADPMKYAGRGFAVAGVVMGSAMIFLFGIGVLAGALFAGSVRP